MNDDMNSCEETHRLILHSVEGTLGSGEQARLASHLAGCAECRRALADQADVKRMVGALPLPRVSADFVERVRQRVAPPAWLDVVNWRTWTLRLAPVAAILVVLAWVPAQQPSALPQTQSLSGALDAWTAGANETQALLVNPESDVDALLAAALGESSR